MTSSNRTLNRLVLLAVGLGLVALALVVVARAAPAEQALLSFVPALPAFEDPASLWLIAVAAALGIVLAAAWIGTRGRGRTSRAYDRDGVVIDEAVVAGLLRESLAAQPDVLAVAAHSYRRGGGTVLARVEVRTRPDLSPLLDGVRAAVEHTDATLGAALPMVVHLTSGVRTATRGARSTR